MKESISKFITEGKALLWIKTNDFQEVERAMIESLNSLENKKFYIYEKGKTFNFQNESMEDGMNDLFTTLDELYPQGIKKIPVFLLIKGGIEEILKKNNLDYIKEIVETKKELKEKLSPLFIINAYSNEEDYHRGIVNLSEIANMALSPGTNDPNTAIMCINKMSSLLGKLLSTGNHFVILKEDENVKIIYQSYSVKDELYLGFSQIISYSAGDPLVTKEILQGIYIIYIMADISAKKSIKSFFDDSYEILIENFTHEIHLDIFKRIKNNMEEYVSL